MSKDTPEVGDVWIKNGSRYKFIITNLGTKDNTWISRLWSNGFADSFPPTTHLEYYHRYMGNFKISKFAEEELDDLFNTENEK
jgi:hypothetical protein